MAGEKTMIWVGVAVVAVAAVGGVTYWAMHKKDETPVTAARKYGAGAVAVDYDATASMWEDEDRIYHAAAKLDGGYYA